MLSQYHGMFCIEKFYLVRIIYLYFGKFKSETQNGIFMLSCEFNPRSYNCQNFVQSMPKDKELKNKNIETQKIGFNQLRPVRAPPYRGENPLNFW